MRARLLLMIALLLIAQAVSAEPALGVNSQDALRAVGPQADHILSLWNVVLGICTVVFAAVLLVFVYALWRAPRGRADTQPDASALHKTEPKLRNRVVGAIVISTVLLLGLITASVLTDRALARMALEDAVNIDVTANQWWWDVRYDNPDPSQIFTTANELHIPVGRPVILKLRSSDVIHSFWVPNIAGKKDLIPGRTATLQMRADRAGTYRGQCAEFCGLQHAWMSFVVIAEDPDRYEAWAAKQREPAIEPSGGELARGKQLFLSTTCVMCHAIQGTDANARHAPDLTHVGGRQALAAGVLPNTPENLAAWIANPQVHKPGVNMPAHAFAQQDLHALAAYLHSLK
ncbi:MAG TPA: cytochrome c oxidase subunit II [Burkholderiaceae bacterium]|nr:cytochrome c oxidase subunit II [Burkholderiaceae bacterium]